MTMLSEVGVAANAVTVARVAWEAAQRLALNGVVGHGDVLDKRAAYDAAILAREAEIAGYAANPEEEA